MSSADKENNSIKDNLRKQGVSSDEIQKVYRTLKDKGYGEEEARSKSRAAAERLKQLREMEERRKGGAPRTPPPKAGGATTAASGAAADAAGTASGKAAEASGSSASERPDAPRRVADWLPAVPHWLRRRINRYAYLNGFAITRFPQLVDDFLAYLDRNRPDCASRALLALLADERGFQGRNPYQLSLIDTLDALRESAQRLLGLRGSWATSRKSEEIFTELRAREPFAVEFLSVFTQPYEALRKGLEYLGTAWRMHRKVPISDLARVVKDGCRLIAITDALERERLVYMLDAARQVNLEKTPGVQSTGEILEAETLFQASFQNLGRFAHEMYPAVLKMIAAFYTEEDVSPEKKTAFQRFLGITDNDLLTWEGWERRVQELREKELRERQERELARLEQEKTEAFSVRFQGTLAMLSSLFPESGIERLEQGEFLLPYFTNRIFPHSPLFQSRAVDLESMSAQDVMGSVLVMHSLIDDMLSSIEPGRLEKLVGREGFAADFYSLRDRWREAYPRVFEPYLDAVREFARETNVDPRYAQLFRESQRARSVVERIDQLRHAAIGGIGRLTADRERLEGPGVHVLANKLSELLTEAGLVLNQSTLAATDPVGQKVMEDLGRGGFVDFVAAARPGTVDYHPVTRQVKRWVEARYRANVLDIPQKAQVAFLDVLRGVVYLYDIYLNDQKSPAALGAKGIFVSTTAEHAAWNKERAVGARDAQKSLQATLGEQFPGRYLDALTGLHNKDYFLNELPQRVQELRARSSPLTLLIMDIDHFKWVNDSLGHNRGDEVLKATATMILDNIREGDVAIRYGGEEVLVVVPSEMHTGIVLAERLRFAQEARVIAREGMQDVRTVGWERGEPCGTLSVGVADITTVLDLQKAVERTDRALYAAKKTRNLVVLVEGDRFTTYAEYRARTAPVAAQAPPARGRRA